MLVLMLVGGCSCGGGVGLLHAKFGSLISGTGIFKPVTQVVHLEQFARLARSQTVELFHVHLQCQPGRVRVLGEPLMQSGQLELRVEARPDTTCGCLYFHCFKLLL